MGFVARLSSILETQSRLRRLREPEAFTHAQRHGEDSENQGDVFKMQRALAHVTLGVALNFVGAG